ncbi:DNA-binding protein [Cellvibrio sp. UBA7671]|uniref:DNA-binding protein n=1 Tax=Cellvibrio sp. UBA7671 TaxID=1946312 RepID=UPI002F35262A
MIKTVDEVIEEFRLKGTSVADWARKNNVNVALVYQVLKGKQIPVRGESHKIAVLLGLKNGSINSQ